MTLKSGSEVTQGHRKCYHSIDRIWFPRLVFFSNFVRKTHRFWDIRHVSIQGAWNPGQGSLKIIKNDTTRSGTHDFLLTFHSNHQPILHCFWDKWRFPWKIFPPRVFCSPTEGVSLGIGYRHRGRKKLECWRYEIVENVLR